MALPKDVTGRVPYYGSSGLMPRPGLDRTRRTNNRLIRGPYVSIPPIVSLLTEPTAASRADWSGAVSLKAFSHPYNADYNTASQGICVLSKGHIIAFNDAGNIDFAVSGEASQRAKPIGMNYLNLMQPVGDRLAGNRPGVATSGYFELPVFPNYTAAGTHKWGAILANDLKPGDYLRACNGAAAANAYGGANAVGWLTNMDNGGGAAKLTSAAMGIIAQVMEFDQGPSFDGLVEWVQEDDPREWEDAVAFYIGGDATKIVYRDPSSPTGFSYNGAAFDTNWPGNQFPGGQPTLEGQPWKDAPGVLGLTDGANWETWQQDSFVITTVPAQTTATLYLYYHIYAGTGAPLRLDGSAWNDTVTDLVTSASISGVTLQNFLRTAGGGMVNTETVASAVDDGKGTIVVSLTGMQPSLSYGAVPVFFLAKGQVAGVPAMIDIAKCSGLARFTLNMLR